MNDTNFYIWKSCIPHILFQDKVEYVINIDVLLPPPKNASSSIKRLHEKYRENNRIARDIMLTFMESDIKILFEEYEYAKNMFIVIFDACGPSSETHIQLLIEKFNRT